jgi:GMP synthase (glutamine-hydrolysing)
VKLAMIKCGAARDELAARFGDYEDWFSRGMPGVTWDLLRADVGSWRWPRSNGYAGILITGSPASVTQPTPWMGEVAEMARETARTGRPVLGVCFGHQLLGWAFGARVVVNPRGWELGTQEITLTARGLADPLFRGCADAAGHMRVNETHEDVVDETSLPPEMVCLAANARTPVQSIAVGDHVRGVQFHPEVSGAVGAEYCLARSPFIGQPEAEALAQASTDTPLSARVLTNFLEHFVRRA